MPTFPLLSSGAICQYPTQVAHQQSVAVLRFLDGSDQRFLNQGRQFRRWQIQLDLLRDDEMSALELFFTSQMGDYLTFDFCDPFTNSIVPNCVLGSPVMMSHFSINGSSASLWVVETNG